MMKVLFVFIWCISLCSAISETFNFVIPAKSRECFFQEFEASTGKKIDAFVLSGGTLDILLTIHGPLNEKDIYNVSLSM